MTFIVSWRYNGVVHTSSFNTLEAAQLYYYRLDDPTATITVKV